MTYAEAVAYFKGNASALARALGIRPRSVFMWKRRGIPVLRQYQLEQLSNGELRRN